MLLKGLVLAWQQQLVAMLVCSRQVYTLPTQCQADRVHTQKVLAVCLPTSCRLSNLITSALLPQHL